MTIGGVKASPLWASEVVFTDFQRTPPPPRNKGLIAGLIKGNQWLISPKNKALVLGGGLVRGGLVDQP